MVSIITFTYCIKWNHANDQALLEHTYTLFDDGVSHHVDIVMFDPRIVETDYFCEIRPK